MERSIRYQAAIIQDDHLLLLKVWDHTFSSRTFWLVPGGAREPGESEEEAVKREVAEETHLEVVVQRLLFEEADIPGGTYERTKTYLCKISQGTPKPGLEPEVDSTESVTIQEVGWFDLRDSTTWDALALNDPITLGRLHRIQAALGYREEP